MRWYLRVQVTETQGKMGHSYVNSFDLCIYSIFFKIMQLNHYDTQGMRIFFSVVMALWAQRHDGAWWF